MDATLSWNNRHSTLNTFSFCSSSILNLVRSSLKNFVSHFLHLIDMFIWIYTQESSNKIPWTNKLLFLHQFQLRWSDRKNMSFHTWCTKTHSNSHTQTKFVTSTLFVGGWVLIKNVLRQKEEIDFCASHRLEKKMCQEFFLRLLPSI